MISKSDVGIFLGYLTIIKSYRVFKEKKKTLVVEEPMYIVFDGSNAFSKKKGIEDDDVLGLKQSLSDLKLKDKIK